MEAPNSPPPGGDRDRSPLMLAIETTVITLAVISVFLRMVTRHYLTKSVGWDDWTCVGALVGTIIGAGLVYTEIGFGYGRHRYYLTKHKFQEYEKFVYLDWIQTFFTLLLTKISICLLLLRIAISKKLLRPVQGLIGALVFSHIIIALLWILQCRPVDAAWDMTKPRNKCFEQWQVDRILLAQGIVSIFSDLVLATLPILILRNVQISTRLKIAICGLMGLGIITAACCTVRTVLNWENGSNDPTWITVPNVSWRFAEVNLGITVICMPTLLPLYRYFRGFSSSQETPSSTPSPYINKPFVRHTENTEAIAGPSKALTHGTCTDSTLTEDNGLPLQIFEGVKTWRAAYEGTGSSGSERAWNNDGVAIENSRGNSETKMCNVHDLV